MRPIEIEFEKKRAISFSVGRRIGDRISVDYDPDIDRIDFNVVEDNSLHYADIAMVPSLGVMAADDRAGPPHLGAKPAINRLKAIFSEIANADLMIEPTVTSDDVQRALANWGITEFSYVVRPFNPHPPGDLSEALSESYAKDNIGIVRTRARPAPGQTIHASEDGHIAAAVELADAGYGQYAVKGIMPEGHEAKIAQPKFEDQVEKNVRRQGQPRELKIIVQEDDEAIAINEAIKGMVGFYNE
jgi:hypothetical protein